MHWNSLWNFVQTCAQLENAKHKLSNVYEISITKTISFALFRAVKIVNSRYVSTQKLHYNQKHWLKFNSDGKSLESTFAANFCLYWNCVNMYPAGTECMLSIYLKNQLRIAIFDILRTKAPQRFQWNCSLQVYQFCKYFSFILFAMRRE